MNNLLSIFLMGGGTGAEGGNPIEQFGFLALIIVVFYFFMIRPQMKKQKELTNYRKSLEKGDKVITTGGIYGKITDVKDNTVTVEIADNVKIKVDKSGIVKDPGDISATK